MELVVPQVATAGLVDHGSRDAGSVSNRGHGFVARRVEAVANAGDTAEEMAYDPKQLAGLCRLFEKIDGRGQIPTAILLSGGGNDVAGKEFAFLLNHRKSGLPILNEAIVRGVLEERLRPALVTLISAVTELSRDAFGRTIPILVHGYDHPVPDGRGFLGGFWLLPGPWLEPGFRTKGHEDLQQCSDVMEELMDRFNALVADLAGKAPLTHVKYVDLRGTLSNELENKKYRRWWADEW